jgi:hypothetical protein
MIAMHRVQGLPAAALALVAACAVEPTEPTPEATTSSNLIIVNHILVNHILVNHILVNHIAASRLSNARLTGRRLKVNASADPLLRTPEGRDVFGLVVSCAMPAEITIVATLDGNELEFPGDAGLAPLWLLAPLDEAGQRWVSACMLSRVNDNDVAIPISMRGPSRSLDVSDDERSLWSLEEGAFFGNVFTPPDEPIQWFACRGRDKAAGDTGALADRSCAAPDPAHPGFTLCGFTFAGECGSSAADRACESFSASGTYYRQCHTAPLGARGCVADVFPQVITTFVTP